jgi:hypothetical protein
METPPGRDSTATKQRVALLVLVAPGLIVVGAVTFAGVASFLLPKVTVGFPGNYRASCQFPLLKQDVATPDF